VRALHGANQQNLFLASGEDIRKRGRVPLLKTLTLTLSQREREFRTIRFS
jgi:hypothetical protein